MNKAYVGVGGAARNVKNIYVGVGGVPRKVVKGYVGVNGVPRLFWNGGGGGGSIPSWEYWRAKSSTIMIFNAYQGYSGATIRKKNNFIAYFAAVRYGQYLYKPLLLSPYADAVVFRASSYGGGGTSEHTYTGTITDSEGITWYYSGSTYTDGGYPSLEEVILDDDGRSTPIFSSESEAAQRLLDRVYAVPYQNNYVQGNSYTLSITDLTRTLEKIFGLVLYRYVTTSQSDSAYSVFSSNSDYFIDELKNRINLKGDTNGFINCSIGVETNFIEISVAHGTVSSWGGNVTSKSNMTAVQNTSPVYGYSCWNFEDEEYENSVYPDWQETITINNGSVTYATYDGSDVQIDSIPYTAGVSITNVFGKYVFSLTNFGVDL